MKIPLWYTTTEIKQHLERDGYPVKCDIPTFLQKHLQKAFEKGWQKAVASQQAASVDAKHSCRNCGELQGDQELCPNCGEDPHH